MVRTLSTASALVVALAVLFISRAAGADVLQVPVGAKAIALGESRVLCGALPAGWTLDPSGRKLRPPAGEASIGQSAGVSVANTFASCTTSPEVLTLVTTDRLPIFDQASTVFFPDEARVEVRGHRLRGVGLFWQSEAASGIDFCHDPQVDNAGERCTFRVGQGLSADPDDVRFRYVPSGGRAGTDVTTFDIEGRRLTRDALMLTPARVIVNKLVAADASVNLSTGQAEVPLFHPEAVTSVDCGQVPCELSSGKLRVRGLASAVNAIDVRFRLLAHVYWLRKDVPEPTPSARLSVMRCPMSIVSGEPVRGTSSARAIVKLEGRCAGDVQSLHFFLGNTPVDVLKIEREQDTAYVVLRLGTVDSSSVAISAARGDGDPVTVAVSRTATQTAPQPRSSLEIPGYPNIDFIPTNTWARVHSQRVGEHEELVLLPIEGVYEAQSEGGESRIRGQEDAAGLTELRFGYRLQGLPAGLSQVDLAVVVDPLQRRIQEARIPAAIGASALSAKPLVELSCSDGKGKTVRISPGETARLAFALRDSCRLIFHRDRLNPELGSQKLNLEVQVVRADGSPRPDGHITQLIVLRAGAEPRIAWIKGVAAPFDRVLVRLSQMADESFYLGGAELLSGAPAAQWSVIMGTARARLYATTAIPTGLYRLGDKDHSGVLSLNFGLVSRLTWLDDEGQEGFVGLEGGLMAIGLGSDRSSTGQPLTQLGVVGGIGLSVPIANKSAPTQASINLHAWFERNISHDASDSVGGRSALIIGPSISIGNVGANL